MVSDISLRGRPFCFVYGIGASFLLFVFSGSKSCKVLGLAWLEFCIISSNSFFLV